jgi:hypothetical protein
VPTLGSLNLTTIDPDTGLKQLDVIEDAMRSLYESGIVLPSKPQNGFNGTIPASLTDLGDDELGDLLQQLSNWCGFIGAEFAKAESELEVAKAQLEFIQSSVRIALKAHHDGRMTVQDKTDAMRNDVRVSAAHSKYLFHFTRYNVLKSLKEMAQRSWETVSRRITQRGQDIERMRRVETVANQVNQSTLRNPFRR